MLKGSFDDKSKIEESPATPASKVFHFCHEVAQKARNLPYNEVSLLSDCCIILFLHFLMNFIGSYFGGFSRC